MTLKGKSTIHYRKVRNNMADIQLVIKIPKEQYHLIMTSHRAGVARYVDKEGMMYAIKNGTPLPKGHGRIADIDKVLEEMKATRTYDIPFALDRVKPIIEADNEDKD